MRDLGGLEVLSTLTLSDQIRDGILAVANGGTAFSDELPDELRA